MKLAKMLSQCCKIILLKTFNLVLNLLFISDKASNRCSVIYSEMNIHSVTNILLLQNKRDSYKFMFSLKTLNFTVTVTGKRFYNLLYKPMVLHVF